MFSIDLIVLLVVFVLTFILTLMKGEKFTAVLILAFYPALLIWTNLPSITEKWGSMGAFIGILLVAFFLIFQAISGTHSHFGFKKYASAFLISVSITILFSIIVFTISPFTTLLVKSALLDKALSVAPLYVWLSAPLLALFIKTKI